jgi:hypothetical protein
MIRLIQFTVLLDLKKQVNSIISLAFSEGSVRDHADREDLRNDQFQNAQIGFLVFFRKRVS